MKKKFSSIVSKFKSINKVILYLTMSDVFTWIPLDLIDVFIGLFLASRFGEDTIIIVGIGLAIKSLSIGLSQIPIGFLIDRMKGMIDELTLLAVSSFIMGGVFLFYPIIDSPEAYYFLQLIFGIGVAINLVTWRKLFALNLDKDREGLEYGVYQSIYELFKAVFSIGAGFIASLSPEAFNSVVIGIGVIIIVGSLWPIMIYKVRYRVKKVV